LLKEILPGLYKLEIPLPNIPLKAVNCYIIKGRERNLIIDPGMDRVECISVMKRGLSELGVDLENTDFFITHMHSDHAGLIPIISTDKSLVYCSLPDADRLRAKWKITVDYTIMNGFPEVELQQMLKLPGFKPRNEYNVKFVPLKEGNKIRAGDYLFRCIETPGHTMGHMCLYDSGKKVLVAGDHIMKDITPNIALWSNVGNPVKDYIDSLDKIFNLDVNLVLPGHRRVFKSHKNRINEIKLHHDFRSEEILSVVGQGVYSGYEIASKISWNMTNEWRAVPVSQKWFATGETIAHLKFLQEEGYIKGELIDKKILFSLK